MLIKSHMVFGEFQTIRIETVEPHRSATYEINCCELGNNGWKMTDVNEFPKPVAEIILQYRHLWTPDVIFQYKLHIETEFSKALTSREITLSDSLIEDILNNI